MLQSVNSYRTILLLYSLWCIVWMILHALVIHGLGYHWGLAIVDSVITNILLALFSLAIGNIIRFYQPARNTALNMVFWSLLISALWAWLVHAILSRIQAGQTAYLVTLQHSIPVRFAIGVLTVGCTVLLVWVWQTNVMKQENVSRQAIAETLAREAELSNLRQQLQPHFLFNSLNSISALIGSRPQEARLMIQQLSDFLRGTLRKDDTQMVTLEEELQHLQLYLDIEKVRFGHRLTTEFHTDESCMKLLLPALLLQPIVENAIKFGLYDTTEEVVIKMECRSEAQLLTISVENPFDPQTAAPRQGTGFGLKSVKRRLYLLYARNDLLKTTSIDRRFITTVTIPQPQ